MARPKNNLLESDIRLSMKNTASNTAAAKFLGVSYNHFKHWAKQYIDSETGETLFDMHKAIDAKTGKLKRYVKRVYDRKGGVPLDTILNNNCERRYPLFRLKHRLIRAGLRTQTCESCGYEHRRETDKNSPLLLRQISDDRDDYRLENLEILCYNCYYIQVGNIFGHKSGFKTERPEIKELKEAGIRESHIKIDEDGLPTNLEEYEENGDDTDAAPLEKDVNHGDGQISHEDILAEVKRMQNK